ncbi:hypothetical protein L7F22_002928 [Adiantum nelumboides]|nr:hypothetical protein [Adiantum nelumboides]
MKIYLAFCLDTNTFFNSDDVVFCMFEGNLKNLITALQEEYGLAKNVNAAMLMIKANKTLCIWGTFSANKVVVALVGKFVFILYDTSNRIVLLHMYFICTFKTLVKVCWRQQSMMQDSEGKISFHPGLVVDKSLACSDMSNVLKVGYKKTLDFFQLV